MDELLKKLHELLEGNAADMAACEAAEYEWSLTWAKGRRSGLQDAIDLIEAANLMVVPE